MKKIASLFISLSLSIFAILLVTSVVMAANNGHTPVTICHATASETNPYVKITVDDDAVDGDGNSDHNRDGHQDGEDIIPPGSWDSDGRNWNAQGQAIWANDCTIPVPTQTPSPSVQPSPTLTQTPRPTIQLSPTPTIPMPCGNFGCGCIESENCVPTPTPIIEECPSHDCGGGNIVLTPTPTITPNVTGAQEPTSTPSPTNTPSNDNNGTGGGGTASVSSASSSTSNPSTPGQVLGTSTLAATGTFTDTLMNISMIVGLALIVLTSRKYVLKRS
ncbi:MAG: hypothetical protein ACMG6E_06630 [Candidatus Roizmanbacteria bacterium]